MMTASNIHYEPVIESRACAAGGIGRYVAAGSENRFDSRYRRHNLHLLKRHSPYHESDHVLNIAFNILAGGKRLEHLELRRNDEVYLNALGAQRLSIQPRR